MAAPAVPALEEGGSAAGSSNAETTATTTTATTAAATAPVAASTSGCEERVDVFSNFDQYRIQRPDGLLRMDMHRPAFRPGLEEVMLF